MKLVHPDILGPDSGDLQAGVKRPLELFADSTLFATTWTLIHQPLEKRVVLQLFKHQARPTVLAEASRQLAHGRPLSTLLIGR